MRDWPCLAKLHVHVWYSFGPPPPGKSSHWRPETRAVWLADKAGRWPGRLGIAFKASRGVGMAPDRGSTTVRNKLYQSCLELPFLSVTLAWSNVAHY